MKEEITTLGELKDAGYKVLPIKEELRKNLVDKIRTGEVLFPGIIGFEETVIPQIENALLSGQDMILLGERGQAKSRIVRSLTNLLDERVPVIAGCEINDNPYRPICKRCRDLVEEKGDQLEINWLHRDERYGEKLATPDVTTPDLIGEVDPIKVAEGRYLSDELTIHYGLIPRTNRGIFCLNELPDLSEKIQVGLFNIMEERDIQIRGFKVRLPLDVLVVATANPEDYTNRGRIITPLKDRYGAEVRTHYPKNIHDEIQIMEQERHRFSDEGFSIQVPMFMKEIVAELTNASRHSPDVSQRSGVSVRMSINNYETLLSNALKRSIRLGEQEVVPRISDLPSLRASTTGKLELEAVEEGKEDKVIEGLVSKAVRRVFNQTLKVDSFGDFVARINSGGSIEVSDVKSSREYANIVSEYSEIMDGVVGLECFGNAAMIAAAVEFILEGLHLNERLNKDVKEGRIEYRG
jgi:magnesium chelatase subunit I